MSKFVWLVLLLVAVSAIVAESTLENDDKGGPCGKFSTLRILTHKLRHCEKAARNVKIAPSTQCCRDLKDVSVPCLHAVFSSDAFKKVGVDPRIAITIPRRCHHVHH
ncbi:Bifunctional inhibitor/plant lipid transfer protein/seed storage helical domain [Sesbania bispinosa]|nr:Bifunctional inhibitor/plant lipid transfer protein/seed storage helical domain [Sesbania bispinosa]KAJ1422294.1 Bifunctional inhibitor/plant lipid transfer protein/seed storage helical domain [Sesbania bispinosa]